MTDAELAYKAKLRDKVAMNLCNFVLKTVATEDYKLFVKNCSAIGLEVMKEYAKVVPKDE